MSNDELMTTREAARLLHVSESYLERDRGEGKHIPYVRIGKRAIRYRRSDLERFMDSRVRRPVIH